MSMLMMPYDVKVEDIFMIQDLGFSSNAQFGNF